MTLSSAKSEQALKNEPEFWLDKLERVVNAVLGLNQRGIFATGVDSTHNSVPPLFAFPRLVTNNLFHVAHCYLQ